MKEKIAIINGIRTPMGKVGGMLKNIPADILGVYALKEAIRISNVPSNQIDEVIFGNVAQPPNAANIARVIALKAALPIGIPAYTVHRNCASGMEAITSGADKIMVGRSSILAVGGSESMSNIPLLFGKKMSLLFEELIRAKTFSRKLLAFLNFRLSHLKPVFGLVEGLTDPVCGMIMGRTAEVLAREFKISRVEQDEYALMSHRRACDATKKNIFKEEIVPVYDPKDYSKALSIDEGPRKEQSKASLEKLKPYFDRKNGTVTIGNSCPVSDGACALVLMSEKKAKSMKLKPLGYLRDYAYASLEPHRMGLGPVYATNKLLNQTGGALKDFDLIEMNEAFAVQVIANEKAFDSNVFAKKYLDKSKALGALDRNRLNVNGGAIALGHPVGMTGARLVLHLLKELRRKNKSRGLATLCVGGGQGAALDLEVAA